MKFTPERRTIIVDAIKAGSPKKYAAMLAGIAEKTLYEWIEKGRQQEPPEGLDSLTVKQLKERARANVVKGYTRMKKPQLIKGIIEAETAYRSFLYAVELAEAEGLMQHIKNVRDAGLEDWRASAWYLERRDPENWAKQDRLQVENQHSGNIKTEHAETTRLEIEQKLKGDPALQSLYMQIWERQHLGSGSGEE